jgi:hypothetical protein
MRLAARPPHALGYVYPCCASPRRHAGFALKHAPQGIAAVRPLHRSGSRRRATAFRQRQSPPPGTGMHGG